MIFIGSPKGPVVCGNLNAYIISKKDLHDVPKIVALLCPEEPSSVKQETPLPEKSVGVKSGNIPKAEHRSEIDSIEKDPRVVIEFLISALPWLEGGLLAGIDKRLLEDIRRVCSDFVNGSDRLKRKVCVAVEKLLRSENKLPLMFRLLAAVRLSMLTNQVREKAMNDRMNDPAAAAVQPHADANGWSGDDGTDTEEAASTSKKAVQKQKSKKKSKKSKGRGKK
ncbi:hypothetical protein ZWY2020_013268 [Hordeum vulgare]|nr:hypothetical protein ZWY2020_013268 [Hordeum vulgare]